MSADAWKRTVTTTAGGVGAYFLYRWAMRRKRTFSFRDRVVVITGGSRGLGLVMARQFAAEGARLAICAREEDELSRAADELRSYNVQVAAVECDIARPEHCRRFFATVRDELGPVDVLINNAGIMQVGPLASMTRDDYEQAMDVHFWAVRAAVDEVRPDMRRRGRGRIVNISSIGGQIAIPHMVPYCASKFALVGYSDGLRAELMQEGVYVTTVCPGMMRTGSPRNAFFKGQHRSEFAWFSIGAAIPVLSQSAERAARQIIQSCRVGRAKITLSMPAKLAVLANTLAPELTADLLGLAGWLLPSPGGVGTSSVAGRDSGSLLSPSVLTTLNDQAAARNNEMGSS
ncbi:MAG: SDR family oxidoreductase [Pirellulales bacterium]